VRDAPAMSTVVSADASTISRTFRPVASWMRWALIAWWFLSAVAVVAVGERASTLGALLAAVDAGQVSQVQVLGALPPGAEGDITQEVRWRQDGLARYAEVRYASPGYTQDQGTYSSPAAAATSVDAATLIHQHSSTVQVLVSPTFSWPTTSTFWGWRVPSWLGGIALAGVLCSLVLLAAGPEPWRATRWAWFWAVLVTAPAGALAFAILSGPTPLVPAPRNGARRLTGGWAFLIVLVLGPRITGRPDRGPRLCGPLQ
jgi:hypothetical protein